MTFTRLVLHNFGAYRGQHICAFDRAARSRTVVLIGGMNGAGKSTIMDAIQLALFGKMARCPGRNDLSYDEFLRRAINREARPQEARIQLEFVSHAAGERNVFCLDRSWVSIDGRVRESFEVRRNDVADSVLSESWLEHIDQWFPHSLSQVFFFDGEQLEALADAATSASVLRAAIEGLLGLDLISRLSFDLSVLGRRKEESVLPAAAREELEALKKQQSTLIETRTKVKQELAHAEDALRSCQNDLHEIEARIAREGGSHFDRRQELEAAHRLLEAAIAATEVQLRELAEGAAPLLLVVSLIQNTSAQASKEEDAARATATHTVLADRDRWLLAELERAAVSSAAVAKLDAAMQTDREERRSLAAVETYLDADATVGDLLGGLRQEVLGHCRDRATALVKEWQSLSDRLEGSLRQLAAIPSPEVPFAHLLTSREERRIALGASEARSAAEKQGLERLESDIARLDDAINRCVRAHRDSSRESDDAERILAHVSRVQTTLGSFRRALLQRHARRIESLALDSLHQLLRKQQLVSGLRIDPDTFTVLLTGTDGCELPVERLSAGERQLLATALLWGIRRAAGRVVPLVIDTPLGRLDSSHRMHLVTRYFPTASHQTILLSTDEEIVGTYYDALKPWIGAEYTLTFDEQSRTTGIAPGYFSSPKDPAHVA